LRLHLTGLWRNPDFIKLWAGRTVSQFGSLMGALSFVAVLALNATPFQMGLLMALRVAPGPLAGLFAGVWVDRLRRRPILIITDIGRAALIGSIPAAFFLGILRIEQLYFVAFAEGLLTIFFDVAYRSYLPSLVQRKDLVEANSKLSGSESVVEVSAFSVGGWTAQLLGAVVAAIVDAFSYLVSGIALVLIRKPEPQPASAGDRQSMGREILEGLVLVWKTPVLLAITVGAASEGLVYGIVGSVILIFGIRELGFDAGVLGTLFAIGGISSFLGAVFAGRLTRRFGIGPTMIAGYSAFVLSILLLPLARGPLIIAGLFLVAQQLSDAAITIYPGLPRWTK
jgi:MFS family permease